MMRCMCILGLREQGLHGTVMDGEQDEMCVLASSISGTRDCMKMSWMWNMMRYVCILSLREQGLHENVMDGEQDEMYVPVFSVREQGLHGTVTSR